MSADSLQLALDPSANEPLIVLSLMEAACAMLDAELEFTMERVATWAALRPIAMFEPVHPLTGVSQTILECSGAFTVQLTVFVGWTVLRHDDTLESCGLVLSVGHRLLVLIGTELVVSPHLLRIHHHLLLHSNMLILHIIAHVL